MLPSRGITSPDQMPLWLASVAYADITSFISAVSEAIRGQKIRDEITLSPAANSLITLLRTVRSWIDDIPPIEQPQRFGNKAFRDFYNKLKEEAEMLVNPLVEDTDCVATGDRKEKCPAAEISVYLVESVGNSTRIDYGTGHELSFIAFLVCLFKTGVLRQDVGDLSAVGLRVMPVYLELVRSLQMTYRMEPAGSQGVWSLDDFQFVPFIWGAAQLLGHPRMKPKAIAKPEMVEGYHQDYLLFGCIRYILEMKTGPFEEHSNTLYGISGVLTWDKVHSGLVKMYKAEVLSKYPVIQHFLFSSQLTLEPAPEFKKPLEPK